jgi:hypothetical protein
MDDLDFLETALVHLTSLHQLVKHLRYCTQSSVLDLDDLEAIPDQKEYAEPSELDLDDLVDTSDEIEYEEPPVLLDLDDLVATPDQEEYEEPSVLDLDDLEDTLDEIEYEEPPILLDLDDLEATPDQEECAEPSELDLDDLVATPDQVVCEEPSALDLDDLVATPDQEEYAEPSVLNLDDMVDTLDLEEFEEPSVLVDMDDLVDTPDQIGCEDPPVLNLDLDDFTFTPNQDDFLFTPDHVECEEPPVLDLDDLMATLDSPTPQSNTTDLQATPPQIQTTEFITSPAERRMDNSLSSFLQTPDVMRDTMNNLVPHSLLLRDHHLQMRYESLRRRYPDDIDRLASFHRYHTNVFETNRYKMLQLHANSPAHVQQMCNDYFDKQLHSIMEYVENSLSELEKIDQEQMTRKPIDVSKFRKRSYLLKKATSMMKEWFQSNLHYPYPRENVIESMCERGGITKVQVRKWFSNRRSRRRRAQKKFYKSR